MSGVVPYLLVGLAVGVISGMVGIGGGVLIIPALVYLFGFDQHHAQGTTLGMLVPPIGLLAAWTYYEQDYVDVRVAALLCVGFFIGGFFGAKAAVHVPASTLRRIFGFFVLVVGLRMIIQR